MPKSGTAAAAARVQADLMRRMPPAQRLELAVDMSLMARALGAARLRAEHPEWSEAGIRREFLHLILANPGRFSIPV